MTHYKKHIWANKSEDDKRKGYDYHNDWNRCPSGRYSSLKRAAKDKGLGFDIPKDDHIDFLSRPCAYCGGALNPTGHCLDRLDNSKGYVKFNVVTCCIDCNRMRGDRLTPEETMVAMKAVNALRASKNGTCGS